jgi:quinol monooxygenase YgiN
MSSEGSSIGTSSTVVLAKLTALEGKRPDLVEVLRSMVEATHSEDGTQLYAMHTANDDEVTVWFYERYADADALKTHSTSDAMKAVGPHLAGLVAGRPELIMLTDVASKGL